MHQSFLIHSYQNPLIFSSVFSFFAVASVSLIHHRTNFTPGLWLVKKCAKVMPKITFSRSQPELIIISLSLHIVIHSGINRTALCRPKRPAQNMAQSSHAFAALAA
jgi:hypothetical protein